MARRHRQRARCTRSPEGRAIRSGHRGPSHIDGRSKKDEGKIKKSDLICRASYFCILLLTFFVPYPSR